MRIGAGFLRDVLTLDVLALDVLAPNAEARNFRRFRPDEDTSNRWQDALDVTSRARVAETLPWDDHRAPDGRVMEMLSEHRDQGRLEGEPLTGRHGFSCREAFIHIIASMLGQNAKRAKSCNHIPRQKPTGSLDNLLWSQSDSLDPRCGAGFSIGLPFVAKRSGADGRCIARYIVHPVRGPPANVSRR